MDDDRIKCNIKSGADICLWNEPFVFEIESKQH